MREDWIECTLGEVCFTTSGGTPSRQNKAFYNGTIPWVKSGELDKGVIYDSEEHISEEAIKKSSAKIFPKGTLLFALYGATIGKMATLGVDAATNQAICGIYKSSVFNSEYLYYYLFFRKNFLIQQGIGGTQPNISQTILKKLNIPISPLVEQKAIVKKIEELFSSLDSGIADLKKAQDQLVVYRQAVLKKAFEGELTKEWRAQQTNLSSANELLKQIKEERQKHYEKQLADWKQAVKVWEKSDKTGKKPVKPKAIKEFTGTEEGYNFVVPKVWSKVFLGNLSSGVEYGSGAKSLDSGNVPVIRMGNMQGGKIDWTDLKFTSNPKEIEQYSLKKGDVLFNRTNSPEHVGKTVIYKGEQPAVFAGYLIRVNHLDRLLFGEYLNYFLNSHTAKIYGNLVKTDGVNQSNINGQKLSNYAIPFCSKQEQHQIVREIERRLSVCDKVEESINESLQKAQALRQSILKKAFEGTLLSAAEIAKCKADKEYEPASVLLERIKKEKNK